MASEPHVRFRSESRTTRFTGSPGVTTQFSSTSRTAKFDSAPPVAQAQLLLETGDLILQEDEGTILLDEAA